MDIGSIVVTVLLAGSFFGFILWVAIHSRKSVSEKRSAGAQEVDFSEVRLKNKRFMAD